MSLHRLLCSDSSLAFSLIVSALVPCGWTLVVAPLTPGPSALITESSARVPSNSRAVSVSFSSTFRIFLLDAKAAVSGNPFTIHLSPVDASMGTTVIEVGALRATSGSVAWPDTGGSFRTWQSTACRSLGWLGCWWFSHLVHITRFSVLSASLLYPERVG